MAQTFGRIALHLLPVPLSYPTQNPGERRPTIEEMTPAPIGTGMYIRFDPNKIVLPPIFGGPLPPYHPSSPQDSLKRKREWENQGSSSGFHKFEEALKQAENEEALAAKRVRTLVVYVSS